VRPPVSAIAHDGEMRTWILWVTLGGCLLPQSAVKDGEACSSDQACASGICDYGYCRGSDCTHDACEPNWMCVHNDGGFFGNDTDTCEPLCGFCPLNYSCDPGESGTCSMTPAPLTVALAASTTMPMIGEDVSFTVTASSPRGDIASYAWSYDDGATPAVGGTTATHAFTNVGTQFAHVDVTDATGVIGAADVSLQVCGTAGAHCEFHDECCDDNCDIFGTHTCQ
jgi:hypothetical protein